VKVIATTSKNSTGEIKMERELSFTAESPTKLRIVKMSVSLFDDFYKIVRNFSPYLIGSIKLDFNQDGFVGVLEFDDQKILDIFCRFLLELSKGKK
jgi:hypothetical protein